MGLFDRGTRVTVAATVSRVIDDDFMPTSLKSGVLRALFNDESIVDHTLQGLASGIATRANRMFEYAAKHYTHGLPRPVNFSNIDAKSPVEILLERLEGEPITTEYYRYGPLNHLHWGWNQIKTIHGYDPATNQLGAQSTLKGTPVYLKDMVVTVTDATLEELKNGSLDHWGTPPNAGYTPERTSLLGSPLRTHTPFQIDPNTTGDYLRVVYVWLEDGELKEDSFTMPFSGSGYKDFHQIKYKTFSGQIHWWMYEAGSGGYPEIDLVFAPELPEDYEGYANFFPFVYFRHNGQSMDSDKTSPAYITTQKMLDYLGMDYQLMIDTIHENPDISQVDQAMMMMAVPANSQHPLELQYLYDFFDRLHNITAGAFDWGRSPTDNVLRYPRSAVDPSPDFVVSLEDKKFKMGLGFRALFKRRRAGKVASVGKHASVQRTEELVQRATVKDTGEEILWRSHVPCHIYQFQRTDSTYDEVLVYGMNMVYHIYGQYSDIGDGNEAILMVPMDYSVSKEYSMPEREVLYTRSLHYVFNSLLITKIKWYQTAGFQAVLIIVMIIVTIYTQGATLRELAAAFAANGAVAAVKMILIEALKYMAVSAAMKLFIKEVGIKAAFAVAVVAAATGLYKAAGFGSMNTVWAEQLLQIATNLTKQISESLQDMLGDLLEDINAFNLYVEEQTKLLDDAKKLLQTDNALSPFIFFGETPDEFYQRTIHSGNIGVVGIDAISTFVDTALTLPKINDTLGRTYD